MRYASNVWIIRALKLLDEIDLSKDYNPIKIYNDLKESESDQARTS